MAEVKSWLATTKGALDGAVRKLMQESGPYETFNFILMDACAARFKNVALALSALSEIGGVELLFKTTLSDSHAARLTYEYAGLPTMLYPLFAKACDIAQEVGGVRKNGVGPRAQHFVYEKAILTPEVAALALPPEYTARLRSMLPPIEAAPTADPAPPANAESPQAT